MSSAALAAVSSCCAAGVPRPRHHKVRTLKPPRWSRTGRAHCSLQQPQLLAETSGTVVRNIGWGAACGLRRAALLPPAESILCNTALTTAVRLCQSVRSGRSSVAQYTRLASLLDPSHCGHTTALLAQHAPRHTNARSARPHCVFGLRTDSTGAFGVCTQSRLRRALTPAHTVGCITVD